MAGFAMTCPSCNELCAAGATICECGSRLTLNVPELLAFRDAGLPRCTCGGTGQCTVCVLADLDLELSA